MIITGKSFCALHRMSIAANANAVCLGQEETESTVSFDFDQLPACHIPGSYRASISITGMGGS